MKLVAWIALISVALASRSAADALPEIIADLPVGKLAFVSGTRFGSPGVISVVGQKVSPFSGGHPKFSADGRKLVFSGGVIPGLALFIRDLDSGVTDSINTNALNADTPSLSPDGKKLAFVVWALDRESSQIYISETDGSNWACLTTGHYHNWSPKWSPDGKLILFESTRDGQRQIYVMDSDGGNQINLSKSKQLCHAPAWSPDGSCIAYMSCEEGGKPSIFVMKRDGSDQRNVSKGNTRDSEPEWSPDGNWLAFTRTTNSSQSAEAMDIWVMKKDGTNQKQITRNGEKSYSYQMSWAR